MCVKCRPWLSTNDVSVRVIKTQGRVSAVSAMREKERESLVDL